MRAVKDGIDTLLFAILPKPLDATKTTDADRDIGWGTGVIGRARQ